VHRDETEPWQKRGEKSRDNAPSACNARCLRKDRTIRRFRQIGKIMSHINLNRRQLLRSLGATAVGSALPFRVYAAETASPRVQFIDMSYNSTESLVAIRKSGVKIIGRYYSRPTDTTGCSDRGKILTKPELQAIEADKTMSIVTAFQYCNRCNGYGGRLDDQSAALAFVIAKAKADANAAVVLAGDLKQPRETPIYFGADFDPDGDCQQKISWDDVQARIKAYFQQVNDIVKPKGWKVGVYGFGAACRTLKEATPQLAEYFWLSASLSHRGHMEFFNSGDWHIFQTRTELNNSVFAPGVESVDSDVINPDKKDVGQWRTSGALDIDKASATAILDGRFFLTKRGCCYLDPEMQKPAQFSNTTFGRPARIIQRTDKLIAATFNENDTAHFYIRPSDVVFGLKGNMPDYNRDKDKTFACSA
jgi:hypothetical protein